MKKSLLAVAVAAALPAFAYAQTNVTLSGVFKTGLAQTKFSNGSANNGSSTSFEDGASRFVISGTEDLGQGMKAIFWLDNRFRVDDNSGATGPLGTGAVWVGLEGGFGKVRTGKIDLYYLFGSDSPGFGSTALQHWNVSLMSFVQGAGGGSPATIAKTGRSANVVRYDSPNFGGATFGLSWSPASAAGAQSGLTTGGQTCNATGNATSALCQSEGVPGASKGQMFSLDGAFNRGPLGLGAAYWDDKVEGTTAGGATGAGQKAWRVFGSYDFGVAKVGLTYDESTVRANTGDTKRAAFSIPVTAKLGPGMLMFTYTQAQDSKTAGNKNADTGAKMYVLGYEYPLSKRTTLAASYAIINNESAAAYGLFTGTSLGNLSAPTAGQDTKQLYLGLRHNF